MFSGSSEESPRLKPDSILIDFSGAWKAPAPSARLTAHRVRAATLKLNRARNLDLYLPAAQ
jgi:hypothetical protein